MMQTSAVCVDPSGICRANKIIDDFSSVRVQDKQASIGEARRAVASILSASATSLARRLSEALSFNI
jgi:hypothetical protein